MVGPLRETNIPGGCRLQLVPADRVDLFPAAVRGTIATEITLLSGEWESITPTRFTQEFAEVWADTGARIAMASVRAIIPKDRAALLHALWDLSRQRFVVLHHDQNGTIKVIGSKDEPAKVQVVKLEHGTKLGSDRNQYELQVSVARREKCPFYLQTPPDTVAPGTCAPVTVYDHLGTPLASVPSGGVYQLPPPATTCPTLAQLVAGLTTMYELLNVMTEAQVEQLSAILLQSIDVVDGGGPDTDHGTGVDPGTGGGGEEPGSDEFESDHYDTEDYA